MSNNNENIENELPSSYPEIESFEDLSISQDILRGIFAYGFERPSPIQRKEILALVYLLRKCWWVQHWKEASELHRDIGPHAVKSFERNKRKIEKTKFTTQVEVLTIEVEA